MTDREVVDHLKKKKKKKMCRGFRQNERDRLKINAFYLRLSLFSKLAGRTQYDLPDSLTLHYLPRINGSPLEINHSNIRPDSPAFVTLHRVVSADAMSTDHHQGQGDHHVIYASRERVRASEGVMFEVYLRDHKAVKGVFRKDADDAWRLECKCALESTELVGGVDQVKEVEVYVAAEIEGQMMMMMMMMRERVEMVVVKRKKTSSSPPHGRRWWWCSSTFKGLDLEEIPEEREEMADDGDDDCESDGCGGGGDQDISDDVRRSSSEGGDREMKNINTSTSIKLDTEGVGWAVDVGIWVVCLGVGYLVSKASSKALIRPTTTRLL